MTEFRNEPVQAVTGGARLVAKMQAAVPGCESLDQPAHVLCRCVYFSEITHLAITPVISDRNSIACLGDIDSDESFDRMFHGSPSCDEDRRGPPSNPLSRSVGRAASITERTYGLTLRTVRRLSVSISAAQAETKTGPTLHLIDELPSKIHFLTSSGGPENGAEQVATCAMSSSNYRDRRNLCPYRRQALQMSGYELLATSCLRPLGVHQSTK